MLTLTSYSTAESVAPGEGRSGGIGGGAPLRYGFTSRGFAFLQSWNAPNCAYSIMQLYMGSNFMANLEVVSTLNTLNLGRSMFYYGYDINTKKYNPKVYLGTLQTIGKNWNVDTQSGIKFPSTWPQNSPQKGEALKILSLF